MYYKILMLAFLLNACNSTKKTMEQPKATIPTINGEYQIVEVNGETLNIDFLKVTFNPENTRINGFSGCNRFFGNYTLKATALHFENIGATRKFCEGFQNTEDAILNAFQTAKNYLPLNNKLILLNAEGKQTLILKRPEPKVKLTGTYSILHPENSKNSDIYITFIPDEHKVSGFSGCNQFFGNYTQNGHMLIIKNIAMTKKACPETHQLEKAVLKSLEAVNTMRPFENTITLTQGDIALLTLKKKD